FLAGSPPLTVLYRCFELFDLKNIPKRELIMYAVKNGRLALTPPMKPWLEEKMAFALVHHPALEPFWTHELGADTFELLRRLMPKTWILDPRPVPPHAVIPGLTVDGHSVSDWKVLASLGQKGRRFVIKPSGFSELAWGSRGVSVGHHLPLTEWPADVEAALTFYHVNWCPECQIVRDKLEELGLQYESVIVPDMRPFRKQVFEVSGQYYVPVLKDGDTVLSETRDILSHLETTYGSKAARS